MSPTPSVTLPSPAQLLHHTTHMTHSQLTSSYCDHSAQSRLGHCPTLTTNNIVIMDINTAPPPYGRIVDSGDKVELRYLISDIECPDTASEITVVTWTRGDTNLVIRDFINEN